MAEISYKKNQWFSGSRLLTKATMISDLISLLQFEYLKSRTKVFRKVLTVASPVRCVLILLILGAGI
jgi:hypothetical protein